MGLRAALGPVLRLKWRGFRSGRRGYCIMH